MPERRLFCPEIAAGSVTLSPEESHHAISVLRVRPGDEIILFDGAGRLAIGVVERANRRLEATVGEITNHPPDLTRRLTLAVAMPKSTRQGFLIEKCTELGVAAIWPIITDRSVAHPSAGAIDKWKRRAIEAAKQSRRAWLPTIETPRSFRESLARATEFDAVGFATVDPPAEGLATLVASIPHDGSVLVYVGPEGGFSDAERESAVAVGAVPVNLGPTVLRTETAAIAVCAAVAMSCTTPSA